MVLALVCPIAMPRDIDPEKAAELAELAAEAEAEERRERIASGDIPEGECPYCGGQVNESNLHLTCF